jgi:hypothetical protein
MYTIHSYNLKHQLEFDQQAGDHWMWTDPDRQVGGKNLHVSIHAPIDYTDNTVSFGSISIKTGKFSESIGYAVNDNGKLRLGLKSRPRYGSLTQNEKKVVNRLVAELEDLLWKNRN